MAEPTLSTVLRQAIQLHQAGRLAEAESLYRAVVARDPRCADALHRLGIVALQIGRPEIAVGWIRQAVALSPHHPALHSNLGEACRLLGRLDEATASFQRALALQPDFLDAVSNLGLAFTTRGQLAAAANCCRRALALQPNFAAAHNNLGNVLKAQRQLDAALASFRRALALQPDVAEVRSNLGHVLRVQGQLDEALVHCQRALALQPDLAVAHNNLGNIWRDRDRLDAALASFGRAAALKPDFAEAHSNLGLALIDRDRLDDGLVSLRQALALEPGLAGAHNNLGSALKHRGELDAAIACFRQALAHQPDCAEFHSNLILALHYRSGHDAAVIAAELRRWQDQHARPLAKFIRPHANDRSPDRRLRIGYVSADFRSHPVGWFLRPLFAAHDRQACAVYCYSNGQQIDHVTAQLRAQVDGWREIAELTDQQVVELIRGDQIDILVDLTQHTAKNRLPVFAHKPAPVQASYLGYPGNTGLHTIDYRLTDRHLDPPGQDSPTGTEQPIRLPDTYWCYQPVADPPPALTPLPALKAGYITFGCLNNFCKVTPATLAAWGRLLAAAPTAQLLLHTYPGSHRLHLQAMFAQHGVRSERLHFVGFLPPAQYFQTYQAMDIALDPFPYPGGTTTCDALWMGVPVITLAGPTPVTRGGLSLLANVGLPELVAYSVDDYLEKALALAGDLPRLAALRAGLRERMQRSPLMDAPRFAHQIEAAYRTMWRRWCAQTGSVSAPTP